MEKIKVLFIDDDIELGCIINCILKEKGFDISFHNSIIGIAAIAKDYNPNIIILDIELGAEDGISYIPIIKDVVPQTPIIVASSHSDYKQIERAFQAQAVDFIKKPYIPQELEVYIRKNIVKSTPHIIQIASLSINTQTRELFQKTSLIRRLSQLEYNLLKLLVNNKNELVTRKMIENQLWESDRNDYTINNTVSALRKMIAVDSDISIVTSKGIGYMFIDEK